MGKKRILIIEDDVDLGELYGAALEMEGYESHWVGSGQKALDALSVGAKPNVVILDLSLPDYTPQMIVEKMRQMPNGQEAKVLVISGWDDLHIKAKALQAHGYLQKPVDIETLCRLIEKVTTE